MDFLDVVILSIVEGVTEFLPISSTAHLILTSHILQIPVTEFLKTFEISIQLGAILSVIFLYYKKLLYNRKLLLKSVLGFIPTGILGLVFYNYIKGLLNDPFISVVSLFIGGFVIIGIESFIKQSEKRNIKKEEKFNSKTLDQMTNKDALFIGLIQSISMIPGTSRAAASIFGAMALKFDRKSAVEFSFLLAIPTMLAATTFDLIKTSSTFTNTEYFYLILGILVSFITALAVIKWLIKYVQSNNFIWFGVYRIALSLIYYLIYLR